MRKEPKSFTVEVKRRPGAAAKKPAPFLPPVKEQAAHQPAEALFKTPAFEPAAAPSPAGRILPCLVTEAALETAQAEALSVVEPAPRPRGRPRKTPRPDDLAPVAPRKRGRPRKNPAVSVPVARPAPLEAPVRAAQPVQPLAPIPMSDRAAARRSATSELPRGERWKRRLPKALR